MSKNAVVFCAVPLLVGLALATAGCKGSEETAFQATGRLLRTEGCKLFAQAGASSLVPARHPDCLEYQYDGSTLRLMHVNACFNCCPGEIGADIRVDGKLIAVREREQAAGCHCLCLFDLEMVIEGLPPGHYSVQVMEPYVGSGDEPLGFTVHLAAGDSGRFCVERDKYPWDAGSVQ